MAFRRATIICTLALFLTLPGCIAKTALDVATAPVRVAGKGVDMMTTSQSEADEKRGREIRRREERLGKLQRDYDRHSQQCRNGNDDACDQARAEYAQMRELMPSVPYERGY